MAFARLHWLSNLEAVVNQPSIVVGGFSAPRILSLKDVGSPCINHSISGVSSVTLLLVFQTLKSSTCSSAVFAPIRSVAILEIASPILSEVLNASSSVFLKVTHVTDEITFPFVVQ